MLSLSQHITLAQTSSCSHVPCFVSASCSLMCLACLSITRCSYSLMCLVLSSHAALILSCALLCLSITRCSYSLMCLVLSSHAALVLSCALLCLSITTLLLSCALLCITPLMYLALSRHAHHVALALNLCLSSCLSIAAHIKKVEVVQ